MLYQIQDFYIWMKRRADLATSSNPNGKTQEKKTALKPGETWLKSGDFTSFL